ncbi:GFA family protein [Conexibacter sp. DBS9H8]|uniref:GFA family protein n=1 Tax=Conexibacter sp. DBS9H8 TaxID=2937801 RepID=UPI00200D6BC0|nr:GFA family protein [Conexibacter sp. DBS9H8]
MSTSALTGHCNCGGVRFSLSEVPPRAGYCHCTRCQRRTGAAASAQARIDAATLTIDAGEELLRGWRHPDGGFEKLFCSVCGSHLFSRLPEDPAQMGVRLGVIDGDPQVRPSFRQFTADAAVWEPIPEDGLERHPGPAR